ncbi:MULTISPECIES: NUDIX hydrolase [unclassified Leifsonia]|uniref:NUDIX domain-containing protein n=1 Tax=unclassified Leifsonia TaxID=2663824 RepID=UPI0008A7B038|nr:MULTISPECIES: NUDIX hydrolase [unclassified Leifsonia]SEH81165.1 ADP-ribose pyrophosphatase [Leifsonia sp. CL154]SFL43665.1 ADP-ribose pyrophosphatase [Leifsonia sp. CL147]
MTDEQTTTQLNDQPFRPEVVSSETAFHGKIWDVRREVFRYNGDEITREYVDHTGAVAVLALDDDGRVLLIRQYRHPVRHRDWEIPAGLLDQHGERPLLAAQRELSEEADLEAEQWNVLADVFTSPGGNDEAIRIYLARGIRSTGSAFAREAEEADIEVRWVPLDEAVDAVLQRRVHNAPLIIALLAARAARDQGWSTLGAADEPWPSHPKLSR